MRVTFRPPMYVVAAALLGLIGLLATLQYRWLGQVKDAERERMRTNLASRAAAFAQDFDQEVTRAYLMFQVDTLEGDSNLAGQMAERYDRWLATSRYPRLVKDIYLLPRDPKAPDALQRFNTTTRFIEPAEWPAHLAPVREQLAPAEPVAQPGTFVFRPMPLMVVESVPAIVVPLPILWVNSVDVLARQPHGSEPRRPSLRYAVVVLDRDYVSNELLPALTRQHFRGAAEDIAYDVAVVSNGTKSAVYTTDARFTPEPGTTADAASDLFQVRTQDFSAMANEVRRFTAFVSRAPRHPAAPAASDPNRKRADVRQMIFGPGASSTFTVRDSSQVAIMLQHSLPGGADRKALEAGLAAGTQSRTASTPHWRLVVKHPAGSLETAVGQVRRRNLLVSSGILAVLGASVAFLVVTTRRAQDLARQQMEFVAAVSHELRTPLAVIRSAADNLAEGVVNGEGQVRKYGELVRGEGRRLSEMVEQILELAGIQSGQRGFALRPVPVLPVLHDVVRTSEPLLHDAGIQVEYQLADGIAPVLGDEQALRRVFQNLLGNAIKYGASGGWIGVTASAAGRDVQVTIADRGIGIDPAEQDSIFKPFYRTPEVIAAQIQGAGLGLSLVQRIVEAHGGRITVVSAPGEGSAFTVHLPAASEEPAPRTSSAANPAASGARS